MFYYSHFSGRGREVLDAVLGVEDPFKLAPYEIVERVLKAGLMPVLDSRKTDLWRSNGQVYEVRLAERDFLVAISSEAQQISVQEMRPDAYDPMSSGREPTQDHADVSAKADHGQPVSATKKRRSSGRSKAPSKRNPR